MRERAWVWWTVAGVLATGGYFLVPKGTFASSLTYDAIGAASAAVMLVTARRRLVWWLFGSGTAVWVAGDIVYSYYQFVLRQEPFPSPADALYLSAYPVLGVGAYLLLRGGGGMNRVALLDASIVATGAGLVLWTFVMQPIAQDGSVGVGTRLVGLAYPAADALLLALVVRLLVSGLARDPAVRLIVVSLALLTCADVAFSVVTAHTGYDGGAFDAGWLLSYVLWAGAALHPASRRRPVPRTTDSLLRLGHGRMLLLACSSLLAPAVLLVQGASHPEHIDWLPVGGCAGVLFLLVVLRMAGLVRQVRALALRDELTGLANRRELEAAIIARLGTPATVVLIDLDDFKAVNDRLGHGVGDGLLTAVGARLRAVALPAELVARLGGDEFALLLPPGADAHRFEAAFDEPFTVAGHRLLVRASVGVADCAATVEPFEPLRRADVAMYAAKGNGGRLTRYDEELDARSNRHAELGADLRTALDESQFFLAYQPIVALPSGDTIAVEALVRWQHPERGLVSPADFVPVAEHNGLIVELGAWILREACTRMAVWRADVTTAPQRVSVNVSARQLSEPGFAGTVAAVLAETGLPARCLVVEVTETAVFDSTVALDTLREVKALGVRIALDDFGTGHSSLGLLQSAPVDILKVDKSFVDHITSPGRQSVIAKALIDVSNHMQLTAIAEGVETEAQAQELYRLGYRYVQGYHFGRPTADPVFAPAAAHLSVAG